MEHSQWQHDKIASFCVINIKNALHICRLYKLQLTTRNKCTQNGWKQISGIGWTQALTSVHEILSSTHFLENRSHFSGQKNHETTSLKGQTRSSPSQFDDSSLLLLLSIFTLSSWKLEPFFSASSASLSSFCSSLRSLRAIRPEIEASRSNQICGIALRRESVGLRDPLVGSRMCARPGRRFSRGEEGLTMELAGDRGGDWVVIEIRTAILFERVGKSGQFESILMQCPTPSPRIYPRCCRIHWSVELMTSARQTNRCGRWKAVTMQSSFWGS